MTSYSRASQLSERNPIFHLQNSNYTNTLPDTHTQLQLQTCVLIGESCCKNEILKSKSQYQYFIEVFTFDTRLHKIGHM